MFRSAVRSVTQGSRRRAGVYCGVILRRLLRRQSGGGARKATGTTVFQDRGEHAAVSQKPQGVLNADAPESLLRAYRLRVREFTCTKHRLGGVDNPRMDRQ